MSLYLAFLSCEANKKRHLGFANGHELDKVFLEIISWQANETFGVCKPVDRAVVFPSQCGVEAEDGGEQKKKLFGCSMWGCAFRIGHLLRTWSSPYTWSLILMMSDML